ncbi:glutathione S-transferase family protein [Kiloniella sp. b19]|uniref:glutathione S-transferase family protein n=1 Tax=Kiloniella sp. GXU_MW_B19 TaxID=3141326 RepID=UPI0031DAD8CC
MSAQYRLHYAPGLANLPIHMMLEEIGADYELVRVDNKKGEHKSEEYLKLNPLGRIPVLEDGRLAISETAAIMLHLADRHMEARLVPDFTSPERARFYQWLMYLTNTVQPDFIILNYADRYTTSADGQDAVVEAAQKRLQEHFGFIDAHLAQKGPFMMGKAFSALDFFLIMLCRFGRNLPSHPRDLPALGQFCEAVLTRPSVQRSFEQEGLQDAPLG